MWNVVLGELVKVVDGVSCLVNRSVFGGTMLPYLEPFVCHTDVRTSISLISPDGRRWLAFCGSSVIFASNSRPQVTDEMQAQLIDGRQFSLLSQFSHYSASRAVARALIVRIGCSRRVKLAASHFVVEYLKTHGLGKLWGIVQEPEFLSQHRSALVQGRLGELFAEALRAALPASEQALPLPPY